MIVSAGQPRLSDLKLGLPSAQPLQKEAEKEVEKHNLNPFVYLVEF